VNNRIINFWPNLLSRIGKSTYSLRQSLTLGSAVAATVFSFSAVAQATAAPARLVDHTGDGKSDLTVWRPTNGTWYWINSANNLQYSQQFGLAGDIPIAGDFSYGNPPDGKTDWAIWRPSDASWHWLDSQTGSHWQSTWGGQGDIPVAGDFDGDGKTDLAIWRHAKYGSDAAGMWWVKKSSNWTYVKQQWGMEGDIPVPCDYDNDSKTDYAVFRPSNGNWYIINSSTGSSWYATWGQQGDVPVTGDYDNDGKCDIAYWRPSTGVWWVIASSTWTYTTTQWGATEDRPQPTDHDNDGKTDLIVWRPSNGTWYGRNSSNGTTWSKQWGSGGSNSGGIDSDVALPNLPGVKDQVADVLVSQEQSNWCSLAGTEMVAAYSQVALSQCSLANVNTGRSDCCTNASSASSLTKCNKTAWWMLTSNGFSETDLWGPSALSFAQLQAEVDANRPVIFAWAWTGGGGHTMVLINAWVSGSGQQWVTINNPSGVQTDMLYTAWVSSAAYTHWRDSYNIIKN
jgi:hypothetical protein